MHRFKVKDIELVQQKIASYPLANKSITRQYELIISLSCGCAVTFTANYQLLEVKGVIISLWIACVVFVYFYVRHQLINFLQYIVDEARIPVDANIGGILNKYNILNTTDVISKGFLENKNVSSDDVKRLMLFLNLKDILKGVREIIVFLLFASIITIVMLIILVVFF